MSESITFKHLGSIVEVLYTIDTIRCYGVPTEPLLSTLSEKLRRRALGAVDPIAEVRDPIQLAIYELSHLEKLDAHPNWPEPSDEGAELRAANKLRIAKLRAALSQMGAA